MAACLSGDDCSDSFFSVEKSQKTQTMKLEPKIIVENGLYVVPVVGDEGNIWFVMLRKHGTRLFISSVYETLFIGGVPSLYWRNKRMFYPKTLAEIAKNELRPLLKF